MGSRKKKSLRHKSTENDGLRQLKLFEVKEVDGLREQVEEVALESNPPGATASRKVSCNGHQRDLE